MADKLKYTIDIDTKGGKASLQDIEKALSGVGAKLNGTQKEVEKFGKSGTSIFSNLSSVVKGGIAVIATGAFAAFGKSLVSASAQMETFQAQFEVFYGSAELATEKLQMAREVAATTPFQLPEVIRTARSLKVLTDGALDTADGIRMVGDAATASGVPIDELSTWFGRLYSGLKAGKPVGEAMMRLSELGVISMTTRSKIEDLQKSGADGMVVWEEFAKSQEKFQGLMQNQVNTWEGITSNIGDNFLELRTVLGQGFLEEVKAIAAGVRDSLGNLAKSDFIKNLGAAIGKVISTITAVVKGLFDYIDSRKEALKVVAALAAAFIAVQLAIKGVAIAQVALNAAMMANPMTLIIMAIVGAVFLAIEAWNKWGDQIKAFLAGPIQKAGSLFSSLKATITETFQKIVSVAMPIIIQLGNITKVVFGGIFNIFKNVSLFLFKFLISPIVLLKKIWDSNMGGIQEKTKTVLLFVMGLFRSYGTFLADMAGRFAKILGGVGTILEGIFTLDFQKVKSGFKEITQSVASGWGETFEKVKNSFNKNVSDNAEKNKSILENEKETQKELAKLQTTESTDNVDTPTGDPADSTKAEQQRKKLADLRIQNIQNEYQKKQAIIEASYQEEVKAAQGNAALLAELEIKKRNDLNQLHAERKKDLEKSRQEELDNEKKLADDLLNIKIQNMAEGREKQLAELEAWFEKERAAHAGQTEYLAQLEIQKSNRLIEINKAAAEQTKQREQEKAQFQYDTASGVLNQIQELNNMASQMAMDKINYELEEKIRLAEIGTNAQIASIDREIAKRKAEGKAYDDLTRKKEEAERKYSTKVNMLKEEAANKEREIRERGKKFSIAQAIINTAEGVTKAFAQGGPLGFITGALVTAAGAMQIAMIRAQKFAFGGEITEPTRALIGEKGETEYIAPRKTFIDVVNELVGAGQIKALASVPQLSASGQVGSGNYVTVDNLKSAISELKFTFRIGDRDIAEASQNGALLMASSNY